jgi:CubicO group peptidase (beta-lactamase class C family)
MQGVLELLTCRAWELLKRERLFQPLAISTGGFGPPVTADKTEQAWGHSSVLGKPLDPRSPAASLAHMTVTDWAKFIALHLRGDPANPRCQAAVTYRAGWFISTASWAKGTQSGDTGRRRWHAGSNGRWNAGVVIAPEIDFAVLVACNRGCGGIAAWKTRQTLKALIRIFSPKRTS